MKQCIHIKFKALFPSIDFYMGIFLKTVVDCSFVNLNYLPYRESKLAYCYGAG